MDDLTDKDIDLLEQLASLVSDVDLRARICDVLWVKDRNHQRGRQAIDLYIESFQVLRKDEEWVAAIERLRRAIQLSGFFGNGNDTKIVSIIEGTIEEYKEKTKNFFLVELMKLLLELRAGDPFKYANLSETLAKKAESERDWPTAREYWEIASKWHEKNGDDENKNKCLSMYAETYVKASMEVVSTENPSFFKAAYFIQSAIEAYRRVKGTKERRTQLHQLLLEYQEKSVGELKTISVETEVELSDQQEKIRSIMMGTESPEDAILKLATIMHVPKKTDIKNEVKDLFQKFPMKYLATGVIVNDKGKVVKKKPSLLSEDKDDVQAAEILEMHSSASLRRQFLALGILEPARRQMLLKYRFKLEHFLPFLIDNSFIPYGRELIYAEGFLAGLHGNFLVSTHLLIPQIEESIRYLLYKEGIIVSNLKADWTQDEYSLNKLLKVKKLEEILGEDIVFHLEGLLIEKSSINLRNLMAHGLMNYSEFNTPENLYLWWIILKLCCLFKKATWQSSREKD